MGKRYFKLAVKTIEKLLDFYSISPGTTKVGIVSYSTKVKVELMFKYSINRECVYKALKTVR